MEKERKGRKRALTFHFKELGVADGYLRGCKKKFGGSVTESSGVQ